MCCNPNSYDETNPLMGVVLSGGNSTRMGSDKGLLLKDDVSWVKLSVDKLERFGIPVCVSINSNQKETYQNALRSNTLIEDHLELKGPLGGILSVFERFPGYDLVILACDLPDLSSSLIKDLVNEYDNRSGEHDFFVYSINGEFEPLVGVYTSEGLNKIKALYLSGQLEKHSMKYVLEEGNTYAIVLSEPQIKEFKNYNKKEDIG